MQTMTSHSISYRDEVYRKLIHLSSLWMVGAVYFLPQSLAITLFAALLIGFGGFEYGRRRIPLIQSLTNRTMGSILRNHEKQSMTGAFYVVLAVLIAVILFSKPVAVIAIIIMLVSDTFAALVGRKYGRIKILNKSLEGCMAFFAITIVILTFSSISGFIPIHVLCILLISIIITITELISDKIKIDDNLSIVLISGYLIGVFL